MSCCFKFLLVVAIGLLPVAAGAAEQSSEDTTNMLETIRKKHDFPALAVVVVKDGKIVDRAAVGIRKQGDTTPVTTNDLFHIGSVTKSMTATLAGILVEEGKLRWDITIAEVFPDLNGKMDKFYETVTLEQLLTHHGGVPGTPPLNAWLRARAEQGTPMEQRREFIAAVLAEKPADTSGTNEIYSNQGYAIAGAMMEKVTGKAWETLIQEKLFKPLHMATVGFGAPGTPGKTDQPWGHSKRLWWTAASQDDNPPAIAPAGRVHLSLDDLARYAIFHMEGEKKDGLLKSATVQKLHTPAKGGDYAMGWVVGTRPWAGGTTLWHNGSNTYWYVNVWLAPVKDFAVIIATNTGVDDAHKGTDEAAVAMIKKWLGE